MIVGLALTALAWMSSCTYSPSPTSGSLLCGTGNSCPKGYTCSTDRTCWKDGTSPSGSGGSGGTGGTGGGNPPAGNDLIGTWTFQSGTVSTMCSDGSRDSRALKDDFVDIFEGVSSDLIASFYCDWNVNFTGGKTVLAPPAQTCMTTNNDTNFTWTVVTFEFASSNGQAATLNSRINAAYSNTTGVGTCMLTIVGALTLDP